MLFGVFPDYLFDRNMPIPDNRSCGKGLALGFGLHEDACSVSEHIEQDFTINMK